MPRFGFTLFGVKKGGKKTAHLVVCVVEKETRGLNPLPPDVDYLLF
jgi:hypothetical protein